MKRFPTASSLDEMMTLGESQADDLKYDDGEVRLWLARCGIADGEPYENSVHVEYRHDGTWYSLATYDGDRPPASVVGGVFTGLDRNYTVVTIDADVLDTPQPSLVERWMRTTVDGESIG